MLYLYIYRHGLCLHVYGHINNNNNSFHYYLSLQARITIRMPLNIEGLHLNTPNTASRHRLPHRTTEAGIFRRCALRWRGSESRVQEWAQHLCYLGGRDAGGQPPASSCHGQSHNAGQSPAVADCRAAIPKEKCFRTDAYTEG